MTGRLWPLIICSITALGLSACPLTENNLHATKKQKLTAPTPTPTVGQLVMDPPVAWILDGLNYPAPKPSSTLLQFKVSGGTPPYVYSWSGPGSVDQKGVFTPPGGPAETTVYVKDSKNNRATAFITVYNDLSVPQSDIDLSYNWVEPVPVPKNFDPSGGNNNKYRIIPLGADPEDYEFELISGPGELKSSRLLPDGRPNPEFGTYLAPSTGDRNSPAATAKVRVTSSVADYFLNRTSATTTTYSKEVSFNLRPRIQFTDGDNLSVMVGNSHSFGAVAGAGNHGFSIIAGLGEINSQTGLYSAPKRLPTDEAGNQISQAVVFVSDARGNWTQKTIKIMAGMSLTPSRYFTQRSPAGPPIQKVLEMAGGNIIDPTSATWPLSNCGSTNRLPFLGNDDLINPDSSPRKFRPYAVRVIDDAVTAADGVTPTRMQNWVTPQQYAARGLGSFTAPDLVNDPPGSTSWTYRTQYSVPRNFPEPTSAYPAPLALYDKASTPNNLIELKQITITIYAVDRLCNERTSTIIVSNDLVVYPQKLSAILGERRSGTNVFEVSGGEPPYDAYVCKGRRDCNCVRPEHRPTELDASSDPERKLIQKLSADSNQFQFNPPTLDDYRSQLSPDLKAPDNLLGGVPAWTPDAHKITVCFMDARATDLLYASQSGAPQNVRATAAEVNLEQGVMVFGGPAHEQMIALQTDLREGTLGLQAGKPDRYGGVLIIGTTNGAPSNPENAVNDVDPSRQELFLSYLTSSGFRTWTQVFRWQSDLLPKLQKFGRDSSPSAHPVFRSAKLTASGLLYLVGNTEEADLTTLGFVMRFDLNGNDLGARFMGGAIVAGGLTKAASVPSRYKSFQRASDCDGDGKNCRISSPNQTSAQAIFVSSRLNDLAVDETHPDGPRIWVVGSSTNRYSVTFDRNDQETLANRKKLGKPTLDYIDTETPPDLNDVRKDVYLGEFATNIVGSAALFQPFPLSADPVASTHLTVLEGGNVDVPRYEGRKDSGKICPSQQGPAEGGSYFGNYQFNDEATGIDLAIDTQDPRDPYPTLYVTGNTATPCFANYDEDQAGGQDLFLVKLRVNRGSFNGAMDTLNEKWRFQIGADGAEEGGRVKSSKDSGTIYMVGTIPASTKSSIGNYSTHAKAQVLFSVPNAQNRDHKFEIGARAAINDTPVGDTYFTELGSLVTRAPVHQPEGTRQEPEVYLSGSARFPEPLKRWFGAIMCAGFKDQYCENEGAGNPLHYSLNPPHSFASGDESFTNGVRMPGMTIKPVDCHWVDGKRVCKDHIIAGGSFDGRLYDNFTESIGYTQWTRDILGNRSPPPPPSDLFLIEYSLDMKPF